MSRTRASTAAPARTTAIIATKAFSRNHLPTISRGVRAEWVRAVDRTGLRHRKALRPAAIRRSRRVVRLLLQCEARNDPDLNIALFVPRFSRCYQLKTTTPL